MTNNNNIIIKKSRTHNLKNIDLEIPKNKIVVFTGVSGSGKSSLVFDTIYTEAQRQLIETFSSFARRRLPKLSRPDVDEILNIQTAIVIDQKRLGRTLRSTVGTATEVYTYLRLLFSRAGDPGIGPSHLFSFNHPEGMCPDCKGLGKRITINTSMLIDPSLSIREGGVNHPEFKKGGYYWRQMMECGLFDGDKKLADFTEHELDLLLYAENVKVDKELAGQAYQTRFEGIVRKLERLFINKGEDEVPESRKNAYQKYLVYCECDSCGGTRLNARARSVRLGGAGISDLVTCELTELVQFLEKVKAPEARPLVRKMSSILGHLIEIGVGYLSLNRAVATLSGGESQRLKMARQLDCDLVGLMYILDEPSIGLHPRDTAKLISMLEKLRDRGNSVLVVEHDRDIMACSDHIIDIGPGAGTQGGRVLFEGPYDLLKKADTSTGRLLGSGSSEAVKRKTPEGFLKIKNAAANNLKNISLGIPLSVFTCVTGVAGSGKSSLIHEVFIKEYPEAVVIDQTPVGRSSRSNPATYIKIFDHIRKEFARATGEAASLFSFNSKGACLECKGHGTIAVEMSFLDDVKTVCSRCGGKRYTDEVLALTYRGKTIYDCLKMTINQALEFFEGPEIKKRLAVLSEVGLGYLEIGQPLSTLSGGEAQRIKLAGELHKKGNLYVLDEPTTGLHMADINRLMEILDSLVAGDNTVVVIEHNLDVIKRADYVIDLGPEGGDGGGEIVAEGTPEEVARCPGSWTGRYLKNLLE